MYDRFGGNVTKYRECYDNICIDEAADKRKKITKEVIRFTPEVS